ncbi:MAG: 1-acyl-sn-glycerol-3-phosphate acyltransferase, partial [Clostridiales bacterium]|nr:1-acyl-sn-glycerol-3-phosphate acyltransferase [Clostridiales bacterium]
MIKTILFFSKFTLSLVATIPKLIEVKNMEKNHPQGEILKKSNKVARDWARGRLKDAGARLHITGENNIPKDRAVLFVSNHQSNVDVAIFLAAIEKDKGYIAKEELIKVPLLSHWMKNINCVFMDRSDLRKSAKAIFEGVNILKNGYSLVIFPEGTRSKSSTMLPFKQASLKTATKAKVPIIPVTIDGSYKVLEEN